MSSLLRLSNRLARRAAYYVAAGCVAVALVGCSASEGPLAPPPPRADAGLVSSLLGVLFPTNGVTRNTPLDHDITSGARIGSAGGTISVPGTGFSLVIPRNAVSVPTDFVVTAKAGRLVAYEFEPHGTKFPVALHFVQDLRGTSAGGLLGGLTLGLGYFANSSQLDQQAGTGVVSELLDATVNLLTGQFRADIRHFSGYMVSSGRR